MRRASSESILTNSVTRRDLALLGVASILCGAIYLLAARFTYSLGFPLDDSWIHQTYARNLAQNGEWAFRPGIASAGSTAPVWSFLLALGYLMHLSPYTWTYFLGVLSLFSLSLLSEWAARKLLASYRPAIPWVGIFIVFEWHLSWAALSGMETLLHALIITAVLVLLINGSNRFATVGLLIGLSVWVRPDGLTLLGPALVTILIIKMDRRSRLRALSLFLIGFGSLFIPYLFFNLSIGGTPMPNTFYAKQAEYAAWQTRPVGSRLAQMFLQLLVGAGLILLPGVIGWIVISIRRRAWGVLASAVWCFGYLGIYVMRLPVYQHGRYLMPAMPIFFLFGLLGFINFREVKMNVRAHWFIQAVWQTSLGLVWLIFIVVGARAFAQDVALIESEMVVTAKWADKNLPSGSLIAAHDIGALGFFDDHPLIDLAGLVSPEVIPFIRDERHLTDYLNDHNADYLIAFPDFYPQMTKNLKKIFTSDGPMVLPLGEENMTIFKWDEP